MSQMSACNGSMTAHSCAGLSSLPLSHVLNPLSIASLERVVAGLNRCGAFRIQQQVLHSDAEYSFPVFLVVPLFLFVAQYRALHPSGSIVPFPGYKVERVAFGMLCHQSINRYIKITKFFEDSKSAQISANVFNLVSYSVYDVGVSITATSVTLEYKYRHRCKRRECTRTPIVFARSCVSGCEFQAHTFGVVRQLFDLMRSNHRESAHSWAVGYVCGGYSRNRNGRAI